MSFTHAAFALAGLIAAAGPVVIHLLNRRRYRTLEWGAMSFLRRALQQSRRAVRLRDLALLVLRTAAVLLFGLALARPFFTSSGLAGGTLGLLSLAIVATFAGAIGVALGRTRLSRAGSGALSLAGLAGVAVLLLGSGQARATAIAGPASSRQPVHAIILIDNSRSMAVRTVTGTLLDVAKQRAATSLEGLPAGSRISVLPLCGPERNFTLDAHRHTDDARAAIERIAVTDRSGSALRMLALAAEAARRVTDLPAKQVAFFTDLQASGWPREGLAEAAQALEVPIQVVHVAETNDDQSNEGRERVTLPNVWIDAFAVQDGLAEQDQPATFLATIRCTGPSPVSGVEVTLRSHEKSIASQSIDLRPGQARELLLTAQVEAERASGNPAFLPVTLSVRVSNPTANRLERDDIRHLVVPLVTSLPVVFVDQYGRDENLDTGRIGETYRLRRLLAPRPAEGVYEPLVAVRHLTMEELEESALDEARLVVVAGVERPTENAVKALRQFVEQGRPLVIAAGGNFDPAAWTEVAWLDGRGILPIALEPTPLGVRPSQATSASSIDAFRLDTASLGHAFFRIAGESNESLAALWGQAFFFQTVVPDRLRTQTAVVEATASPRILAQFAKIGPDGENVPYLVEHRIGKGRVLLLSAGISSDWDTLAQTNAIVLLDRITRSLIESTLPRRGFEAGEAISLPIERRPEVRYTLTTPDGQARPVSLDATEAGYALRLDETGTAGFYHLAAQRESGEWGESTWLAVNGSPDESELRSLTADELVQRLGDAAIRFIGPNETISYTGEAIQGNGLWRWLVGAVLLCLLGEMAVAGARRSEVTP